MYKFFNTYKISSYALHLLMISGAAIALSGCARNLSSNSYSDTHVGEASRTYKGTIVSVRTVNVSPEKLGDNYVGTAHGGVAGGVLGTQFGNGRGRIATTAGGAILGALGGAFAENELQNQDAYEYVVEMRNGEMRTVIQGMDTKYSPGQSVLLMISDRGRSRIVPNQAGF